MKLATVISVIAALLLGAAASVHAGERPKAGRVTFSERNLSGPRFGMTFVPGDTELYEKLKDEGLGRSISQFGWHFERQVIPRGGGPQFVVEVIPLLAGVEYGLLIPSCTLAMGVRTPDGYEFGLGPNLLVGKDDGALETNTSLVIAVGKSLDYGGVSIPINLAFATNPEGNRISLIFGYAIGRNGSAD